MYRAPPKHIQDELDRRFPGVMLRWNFMTGSWCLTQPVYNGSGTLDWVSRTQPTAALRGALHDAPTNEVLLYDFWFPEYNEHHEIVGEGIRVEPTLLAVLETLQRSQTWGNDYLIDQRVDEVEAAEDEELMRGQQDLLDATHETKMTTKHRVAGRVIADGQHITTPRGIERSIAAAMREEESESDYEVLRRVAEGDRCPGVDRNREDELG